MRSAKRFGPVRSVARCTSLSLIALVAGTAITGCGGSSSSSSQSAATSSSSSSSAGAAAAGSSSKQVKIGLFVQQLQNPYVTAVLGAMQQTAAKMNATVTSFDAASDPNTQYNQIQDAITSKRFDAMIIWPASSTGVVPYVKQAIQAGIKVGSILFPVGPKYNTAALQVPGMTVSVMKPPYIDGSDQGNAIVAACQGINPCNLGFLLGAASSAGDQARLQGTKDVIASHSNIKLAAVGDGAYAQGSALTSTQDMIQAHPNINVIAAVGGQGELGAQQALKGTPLQGKVKLVSDGASVQGMQELRAGQFFAETLYLPKVEGTLSAKYVIDAVRGSKATAGIDTISERGKIPSYMTQQNRSQWINFKGQWNG